MTRIAAVLAAAVLASGCIFTDDGPSQGTVNLYWDFVRNAPAQNGGYLLYDADLVGTGDEWCSESGVETVEVTSPAGTLAFPCTYAGVQGVALDYLPEGTQQFRVRGWRTDGGVERLLWDHTVSARVVGGGMVDVYVDVEPVTADVDVVGYFAYGAGEYYATCNDAFNPTVTYDVYDSLGTLVMTSAGVGCPAGASAFPLPLIVDRLDLDYYSIRLKGWTGAPAQRTFDSCTSNALPYLEFDHYEAQVAGAAVDVDLWTPPACDP